MTRLSYARLSPLLVAALAACGNNRPTPAPATAPPTTTTTTAPRPPADVPDLTCSSTDYDTALADLRTCVADRRCQVANAGRCGEHRYLERVESFAVVFTYFDAGCQRIATCTGNMEHGGQRCEGQRPACQAVVEQQLGPAR